MNWYKNKQKKTDEINKLLNFNIILHLLGSTHVVRWYTVGHFWWQAGGVDYRKVEVEAIEYGGGSSWPTTDDEDGRTSNIHIWLINVATFVVITIWQNRVGIKEITFFDNSQFSSSLSIAHIIALTKSFKPNKTFSKWNSSLCSLWLPSPPLAHKVMLKFLAKNLTTSVLMDTNLRKCCERISVLSWFIEKIQWKLV